MYTVFYIAWGEGGVAVAGCWCPVPPRCHPVSLCVLQHLRGADELHGADRREARLLLAQPAGGRVLRGRAQTVLQELLPVGPGAARPPERRPVSLHRAARPGHPADDSARGVEEQTQRGHRVGPARAAQGGEKGHLFLEQKAKRDRMGRVQLVAAAPPELPHKFDLD